MPYHWVQPNLDVAVLNFLDEDVDDDYYDDNYKYKGKGLQVRSPSSSASPPLPVMLYVFSSKLFLVQYLFAIDNPFGINQTVTSGVVSALNWEVRSGSGGGQRRRGGPPAPVDYIVMRGCIHKYTTINTINLGGPLLERKGRSLDMNTAIVTT